MMHRIQVTGRALAFDCAEEETLLDAAERAGFTLPYSCRKGVCASCEGGLVAGRAVLRGQGAVAGPRGAVRYCQLRPCSDLEIAPKRIELRAAPARRVVEAFVFRLSRPTPDVTLLHLRHPAQHRVHFRAGQYLQVLLPDGTRRNYSMAGPPQETDGTMLHVRRMPGGRFSEAMLAGLAPGSRLRIELPYGEFFLREDDERPLVLVAGGTGLAPMASILEDLLRRRVARSVALYWGVRREADLYLHGAAERWQAGLPGLRFVPVLSRADPGWRGRSGWVHQAVLDDYPDLAGHAVYASGNPAMVAAARAAFVGERGLDEAAFHADAFLASGGP